MRVLLSAAIAAVIGIALAGTAEAAPKKKFKRQAQHINTNGTYQPGYRPRRMARQPVYPVYQRGYTYQPGYAYGPRPLLVRVTPGIGPFDPNRYPTGTTAWWRAMDYQGRGGHAN